MVSIPIAAAAALLIAFALPVEGATMTRTFEFRATGFEYHVPPLPPGQVPPLAPQQSLAGTVTLTFDPNACTPIHPDAIGLVIAGHAFKPAEVTADICGFSYRIGAGAYYIINDAPYDFTLQFIYDEGTSHSIGYPFSYAVLGTAWESLNGVSVSVAIPPVPALALPSLLGLALAVFASGWLWLRRSTDRFNRKL